MKESETIRALLEDARTEDLPRLAGLLAQAQAEIMARIVAGRPEPVAATGSLSAAEAGARLGVSRYWLYKQAKQLPFVMRIGKRITFDAAGLEKWKRRQMGKAA